MRLIALFACAAGCTPPPAVAPPPHCPDDTAKMLAEPVQLDLRVLDGFLPCTAAQPHVVRVTIDNAPWCEVAIPCTTTIQAPPRSFACTGKPIKPGARTLGVARADDPASLMLRTMSLPAFDYTPDGGMFIGAHVRAWVDEKSILIDPPLATETLMAVTPPARTRTADR